MRITLSWVQELVAFLEFLQAVLIQFRIKAVKRVDSKQGFIRLLTFHVEMMLYFLKFANREQLAKCR